MLTAKEIRTEVEATQGAPWAEKIARYNEAATTWRKRGYPDGIFRDFNAGMMEVARNYYGWHENPPIWYHGGPAGIERGEMLRSQPRTIAEALAAHAGLAQAHAQQVHFTPDRNYALKYAEDFRQPEIYRVEPEEPIQINPQMFCLVGIFSHDPEVNQDMDRLILRVMLHLPSWCAPAARVLGIG